MGESTDDSNLSDETLEATERFDDQKTGKFGGDKTDITRDPRDALNFADDPVLNAVRQAKYIADQNKILADKVNIKGDDKFAQEQYNIDEFGYDPNVTSVNVGAGDIFGLKDSIEKQLAMGGSPVFNKDGTIGGVMGAMRDAPVFGMLPSFLQNMLPDTQVYTGIADLDPNRFTPDDDNTSNETTPPVMNQMTGKSQCPEGYVFDNDLQACRLKTRSDDQLGTPKDPPDGGQMFARNYSLLNQAPMNVPQGFDYNAMNTNFMNRFGTRPSIFKKPPNLLGFTPFGG
tara:strand:+ start:52 stop:909 length:858 start_codon:yes stop_codon:yes gene_type:complete